MEAPKDLDGESPGATGTKVGGNKLGFSGAMKPLLLFLKRAQYIQW